jgi:hypothetical protein
MPTHMQTRPPAHRPASRLQFLKGVAAKQGLSDQSGGKPLEVEVLQAPSRPNTKNFMVKVLI